MTRSHYLPKWWPRLLGHVWVLGVDNLTAINLITPVLWLYELNHIGVCIILSKNYYTQNYIYKNGYIKIIILLGLKSHYKVSLFRVTHSSWMKILKQDTAVVLFILRRAPQRNVNAYHYTAIDNINTPKYLFNYMCTLKPNHMEIQHFPIRRMTYDKKWPLGKGLEYNINNLSNFHMVGLFVAIKNRVILLMFCSELLHNNLCPFY